MPEKDWRAQAEIYRLQLNETAPMLDELEVVRAERDVWKQRASERREGYMKVLAERDALLAYVRFRDAGWQTDPVVRMNHERHGIAHLFDQQ